MKEVIIVALIKCKECGKEISDQAISCPNCGYPMVHPKPNYPDIKHTWDMDSDYYYDTKNEREISEWEYLYAKERYEKELKKAREECYQRTQELIAYINNPAELEEVKVLRFYFTLANENLSKKYSEEGLTLMRNYIKKYKESQKEKTLTKEKRK